MLRGLRWPTAVLILGLALGFAGTAIAFASKPVTIPYGEYQLGSGGYIRVSAIGLPPFGAADPATAGDVARSNALGLAQRRLLTAILALPTPHGVPPVRASLAHDASARARLRDLIARARVSGQELADGSAEVTLELPYEGPGGLAEFLASLSP